MRNPKPKEWLASELSQQYIADYKAFNFVDGEGVRNSLYVSGCPFACEGCFNAASQNFHYGKPFTQELEDQLIADTAHDYVQGVTFLGGEPFLNTQVCLKVINRIRAEFGDTKDIWSCRFELSKKNLMLQFRGSSNQRIIDVKKSLAKGEVVIWEKLHDSEKAFEQIKKSELI